MDKTPVFNCGKCKKKFSSSAKLVSHVKKAHVDKGSNKKKAHTAKVAASKNDDDNTADQKVDKTPAKKTDKKDAKKAAAKKATDKKNAKKAALKKSADAAAAKNAADKKAADHAKFIKSRMKRRSRKRESRVFSCAKCSETFGTIQDIKTHFVAVHLDSKQSLKI